MKNVIKTYEELKEKHNDIVDISSDRMNEISKIIERDRNDSFTDKFLLLSSFIIFTLLLFPVGYNYSKRIISIIISYVNDAPFTLFKNYILETSGIMFFIKVTILVLIFVAPFLSNFLKKKGLLKENKINIEKENFMQIMAFLGFFVLGFLIIIFNIYFDLNINKMIMDYFNFFLVAFFSILIYLIILLLTSNIPYIKRLKKSQYNFSSNYRLEASFELLFLLDEIDDIKYLDNIDDIRQIENSILNISSSIQYISYRNETDETVLDYIDEDYLVDISNAFLIDFINLIHLEKSDTIIIKKKIIEYFNKFISGSIQDLPKKHIKEKKTTNKIISFSLLIVYLLIPFIILFIFKYIYKVDIDELIQSLFKILYIIWAFIGVFSNPMIKEKENKELIREILSIFGK